MSNLLHIAYRVCVALSVLALSTVARASGGWTIVQTIGDVQVVSPGFSPVAAKPSAGVADGSTIKTGATGRAVLLRGRETIVMSPSSAVTLPSGTNRDLSRVKQQSGTLLFKIGKRPEAHFEVNTPYLAAVVKGTTFTVKVSRTGASVHVLEGAVEVVTANRKQSFLTRTGQISSVFARAGNDIFTTGAAAFDMPDGTGEFWEKDGATFELDGEGVDAALSVKPNGLRGARKMPGDASKGWTDVKKGFNERAPQKLVATAKAAQDNLQAQAERIRLAKAKEEAAKMAEDARLRAALKESKDKEKKEGADPEKTKAGPVDGGAIAVRTAANVWTVTQARGVVKIDGHPFTNFGGGLVRSLRPGTKIETGPDSRLGVVHGATEFVIEENSVVELEDPSESQTLNVAIGRVERFKFEPNRDQVVSEVTRGDARDLFANERHENQSSNPPQKTKFNVVANAPKSNGVVSAPSVTTPRVASRSAPSKAKTEEVRTKVLGNLTLGLYGFTALLIMAFGGRWFWSRYRAKPTSPVVETPVQARLRSIKEG
jgi:ferric-dicitrate binding protein FerR (iron transport regulator)